MDFKLVQGCRSFRRDDMLMTDSLVIKDLLQYKSNTFHNSTPASVQIIILSRSEVTVYEIPPTHTNLGQPQHLVRFFFSPLGTLIRRVSHLKV